jgi:hypothetical protein
MELDDFYTHGHWEVRVSKNYAFICCPLMNGILTFGEKRLVYEELKTLEDRLRIEGKSEVTGYTSIHKPHIMRMFTKLGYNPFYLSLKKNILWFKKELQHV